MTGEIDTDLERELDAVLARYGVPTYRLEVRGGEADRGDLASDLADVARRVLPRPDPAGYELVLGDLYVKLRMAYDAHPEHVIGPGNHAATRTCPNCGGTVNVDAEPERRCGGDRPTDRCDDLTGILWNLIEETFPPEEAARWLAAPPAADFLEWGDDCALIRNDLADYVVAVMRYDAEQRILTDNALIPVDPSRTVPDASNG